MPTVYHKRKRFVDYVKILGGLAIIVFGIAVWYGLLSGNILPNEVAAVIFVVVGLMVLFLGFAGGNWTQVRPQIVGGRKP